MIVRLMPDRLELGQDMSSCVGSAIFNFEKSEVATIGRSVMGYNLPSWQRPFVWTEGQSIRLIESMWLGLNIGTYTFNRSYDKPEYDNLLIDGQQRLKAIQDYITDVFPVFGHRYSELCRPEQRGFESRKFHCYITKSEDDKYLRNYYNMMNFGGVSHKKGEEA